MPEDTSTLLRVYEKIDGGFKRIHERLDTQDEKLDAVRDTQAEQKITVALVKERLDNIHKTPCPVLTVHLQDHPDNREVLELVRSTREAKQDAATIKRSIRMQIWNGVGSGVSIVIKAVVLFLLVKLGWDQFARASEPHLQGTEVKDVYVECVPRDVPVSGIRTWERDGADGARLPEGK